jgi:hypothetical protein
VSASFQFMTVLPSNNNSLARRWIASNLGDSESGDEESACHARLWMSTDHAMTIATNFDRSPGKLA